MTGCAIQDLARELAEFGLTIAGLIEAVRDAYREAVRDDDPAWDDLTDREKAYLTSAAHDMLVGRRVPEERPENRPLPVEGFLEAVRERVLRLRH